ncbi:MAG: hypothetical protein HKN82_03695, partial [Akkermansiaceae bacterium]|nr:hypothetical protein [Akkermansiaceae bacterium]
TRPASAPAALAPYSLPAYGEALAALYHDLGNIQTGPAGWLTKGMVLEQFLLPGRFHFLRT